MSNAFFGAALLAAAFAFVAPAVSAENADLSIPDTLLVVGVDISAPGVSEEKPVPLYEMIDLIFYFQAEYPIKNDLKARIAWKGRDVTRTSDFPLVTESGPTSKWNIGCVERVQTRICAVPPILKWTDKTPFFSPAVCALSIDLIGPDNPAKGGGVHEIGQIPVAPLLDPELRDLCLTGNADSDPRGKIPFTVAFPDGGPSGKSPGTELTDGAYNLRRRYLETVLWKGAKPGSTRSIRFQFEESVTINACVLISHSRKRSSMIGKIELSAGDGIGDSFSNEPNRGFRGVHILPITGMEISGRECTLRLHKLWESGEMPVGEVYLFGKPTHD